jgi:hypothetical protein
MNEGDTTTTDRHTRKKPPKKKSQDAVQGKKKDKSGNMSTHKLQIDNDSSLSALMLHCSSAEAAAGVWQTHTAMPLPLNNRSWVSAATVCCVASYMFYALPPLHCGVYQV